MSVETLRASAADRILVLDGASGTQIQAQGVTEDDLRGARFADHPSSLAGNNDLLILTQPDAVRELHRSYLLAGSDIVTTNTFSSTTVAQREYGLDEPDLIAELNETGARLAREMTDEAERADGRERWVLGALGRRTSPSRCHPASKTRHTARSPSASWRRRTANRSTGWRPAASTRS